MTKREITVSFDDNDLRRYEDGYLATLWHVAQANPADGFASKEPGEVAERIGREIIRRWLRDAPVELYRHQGRHHYWHELTKHGKWTGPGGEYELNGAEPTPEAGAR